MRRATRPITAYSGSMPLLKKNDRFGAKSSMCMPAREVVLDEGEAVGQREGQLGDRVGARLGDVVAADRHRVEVPHLVVDEVLLDVAHQAQRELGREDAGVLGLVLLEDVGLHGAAHGGQRLGLDARVDLRRQHLVAGDAQQQQAQAVVAVGQRARVRRARVAARLRQSAPIFASTCVGQSLRADVLLAALVDGRVQEERRASSAPDR